MILVTGPTGNVGGPLVRQLDALHAPFRILVRDLRRAAQVPARVERIVGDLADRSALTDAMADVDRLFLLTPGVGTDHTANAVMAARDAGVRHVVHLSSANVLGDPMPAMGRWHGDREEIIRGSGIPATFLRPGGFMSNALEWVGTIRSGGYVLDPVGPGRFAPIDPADIAAVAAHVLTSMGHEGREYTLTGDEALTVGEQVGILADALGRALHVREVNTAAEAVQSRFPNGAPPVLIDAIVEAFSLMRADTTGLRTDTFRELLGRRPHTFAEWCTRHARVFLDVK